jgi:hypothetical protein
MSKIDTVDVLQKELHWQRNNWQMSVQLYFPSVISELIRIRKKRPIDSSLEMDEKIVGFSKFCYQTRLNTN